MKKPRFDVVQTWLDNVAYSHSRSQDTERNYRLGLSDFCTYIGCTPQAILDDYEGVTDRQFRRKYATFLKGYISHLLGNGYTVSSIQTKVTPVKSFFKYNDLPLGFVPVAKVKTTYHNRDIKKSEITDLLRISNIRQKAFFTVMTQSGLRPVTLCSLRVKHMEPDFSKGIIPCCIKVPEELAKGAFGAYFTFIGEDSVNHLRSYFKTRGVIGPEDYIFATHKSDKRLNRKSISTLFSRAIDTLKENGSIKFDQVKGKPRPVRLYGLRKYFRNHAKEAGVEYVNFWMGHKADFKAPYIPSSDEHYFSREDVEFHRQLYAEQAMPFLRLETATPSEMEQTITNLQQELKSLRRDLKQVEFLRDPNKVRELLEAAKLYKEMLKKKQ